MKTALEILQGARELLSDPAKWAKGFYAYKVPATELKYTFRDDGSIKWLETYDRCDEKSDDAKCFCSVGAIARIGGGVYIEPACDFLRAQLPDGELVDFNDHRDTTHDMVLAKFDAAIAAARLQ